MIKRLDLYILRQILVPLMATLAVSAMLLLLERMLRLFDLVANLGGPVSVVWRMLGNLLPHYLGLALPLGLLLGILMAFRSLSLNSELESMRASGMSLLRLARPAILLSFAVFVVFVTLVGFVQPQGRYAYRSLLYNLSAGAFGASITPGEYNKVGKDFMLRLESADPDGNRIYKIFGQKERPDGHITAITAHEGRFLATEDGETILLRLYDGSIVDIDPRQSHPRTFTFEVYDWPVDLPKIVPFHKRGERQREMTLPELWIRAQSDKVGNTERAAMSAEFHDRMARSLTLLIIPFLAIALGTPNKRSGRAVGMALAIVGLVAAHKMMEFGNGTAAIGAASPYLTMWLPFTIFAATSFVLFYISGYRVGANPVAYVENVFDWVLALVARLRPRHRPAQLKLQETQLHAQGPSWHA